MDTEVEHMRDHRLSRRALLGSSIALAGSAALPARAAPANAPNILFILADDLGYADLSCYGRRDYATPHIDSLARDGLRFLQAYANSAICSATRTALITGRYQDRLAVGLEEPLGFRDVGLPPSHPTLPSLLKRCGYTTYLLGKWHLGALPDYGPLKSGYDHFWGFRGGGIDYFRHEFLKKHDLWDDDREVFEKGYLTDLLGDRAVSTIESAARSGQPFFISLHFNAPHWPWQGPDDIAESDRIAQSKTPGAIIDTDGGSLATYGKIVGRMDEQIGRILARLDLNIADNTIVIFTSDNGGERYSDTWPFSGKKTELLEGGLRVPAIIRWPRRIRPGQTSDQVTMTMDWLPTLLAAANGAPDPAFPSDGIDLLPHMLMGAAPMPRSLCWRYFNLSQEACRIDDWKYLKILNNHFLFNVVDDPLERANLKDRYPETFARLQESYRAWDRQMLPLDPAVFTHGFTGEVMADHFGITNGRTIAPDR